MRLCYTKYMQDMSLYYKLKGIDLGKQSDDYFRSMGAGFNRGRQDAIDYIDRMKQYDPAEQAKKKEEEARALAERQKAEMATKFASDKAELGDFTTRYGTAVPQVRDEAYTKFGVNDKLDVATSLRQRIADLKENISGRAAGGFATGDQVDAAINRKYIPQYNTAAQNLNDATGLANNYIDTSLKPLNVEGQILSERLAREMTGFSASQQRELDTLLAAWQIGATMTENEKNRLNSLVMKEMDYDFQREQLNKKDEERYLSGTSFYDVQTGKWITKPATGNGVVGGGW